MIIRVLLVLGLLWAAPPRAEAVRAETLRIGTEADYFPFNYLDGNGQLAGFDTDIARALCDALQATCEFIQTPWDNLIPDLLDRRFDIVIASMSITEERKARVAFSNPYYRTPMQFIARRGAYERADPQTLAASRIGVLRGTTAHAYVRDRLGLEGNLRLYATQDDSQRALMRGELDFLLADSFVLWRFTNASEGKEFGFVGSPIHIDEGIGVALRKEDEDLRKRINRAITRIRLDGTYQKINARYFPFDIY